MRLCLYLCLSFTLQTPHKGACNLQSALLSCVTPVHWCPCRCLQNSPTTFRQQQQCAGTTDRCILSRSGTLIQVSERQGASSCVTSWTEHSAPELDLPLHQRQWRCRDNHVLDLTSFQRRCVAQFYACGHGGKAVCCQVDRVSSQLSSHTTVKP